ncbi:aspartate ammonia-lyase [Halalkalibacter flavus]|jgi:aspartate ammonia-lyase|uniref:aspartate ammonia-lyase n=1 Tax=Halalkalibacter flavus TaxID=3090668 RepID=UPI002FC9C404
MSFRVERDSLGEKRIPAQSYYGIQTLRAVENFPISGIHIHKEIIFALAEVKKASALANIEIGMLKPSIGANIVEAAEEITNDQLSEEFIVDSIQGGAGTSINMNMNEVIANRALELMGRSKGEYFYCSPNTHVNMSQSTNDTVPTAVKIAAFQLTQQLIETLEQLVEGFRQKEIEFDDVIKMGRTHLQDAVPIRLGQEFGAYRSVIERDLKRISEATKELLSINMGATAVGTGLNAQEDYIEKVTEHLVNQVKIPLYSAKNLIDSTQNTDAYTTLSATLKVSAVNLSKICNDIRLMASGPFTGLNELSLQPRQPGSSIMPGKVNPVMAEVVNQTAFQIIGNDQTICMASESGQFELNVMVPVLSFNLLQSIKIYKNAIDVFYRYLLCDLKANKNVCQSYVDKSLGIITALNPHIGYETAAQLVKEAIVSEKTIVEICLERNLLSKEELEEILNPFEMTTPGIAGSRYLVRN